MTLSPEAASHLEDEWDEALGRGGVERDQWGRAMLIPTRELAADPQVKNPSNRKPRTDGRLPYTSASTMGDYVDDDSGLRTWTMRSVVKGLGEREDLAAMAAALPPIIGNRRDKDSLTKEEKAQDKATNAVLDQIALDAAEHAHSLYKAGWGTAVHSFTDPGPSGAVPERMQADVQAWEQLTAGWVFHATEMFVANDELQAAGTFDHLCSIPWAPELGAFIVDKKTGLLHPAKFSCQLAVYAGGTPYNTVTDERYDWPVQPSQTVALVVHIPLGRGVAEPHVIDLVAGRWAALVARDVRAHRGDKTLSTPAPGLNDGRRAYIEHLIDLCDSAQTLDAVWREFAPVWDDELTARGIQRLQHVGVAS